MASKVYKFLGDPNAFGKPVIKIKVRCTTGQIHEYTPQNTVAFQVNEEFTHVCDDVPEAPLTCRCFRSLDVDQRMQSI